MNCPYFTDKAGAPSAVLIRALKLEQSTLESITRKPREKLEKVAAGPGKLCLAMQIDLDLYGTKLELGQALWLEHRSPDWQTKFDLGSIELTQTTRIGLTQGVDLPWRWYVSGCQAVSKW
jgi:DNA-3-methyladenine glycosylase